MDDFTEGMKRQPAGLEDMYNAGMISEDDAIGVLADMLRRLNRYQPSMVLEIRKRKR